MGRILIGNIKGPQGAQGIQGPQGPVGATGPQGPMPDLINNALTTEAGVAALDAAMGKTLQDQITQLNGELRDNSTFTSNNGCVKLPDGTLIQWGHEYEFPAAAETTELTYPSPFVGLYSITFSLKTAVRYITALSRVATGTTVSINQTLNTSTTYDWIAIGRWK